MKHTPTSRDRAVEVVDRVLGSADPALPAAEQVVSALIDTGWYTSASLDNDERFEIYEAGYVAALIDALNTHGPERDPDLPVIHLDMDRMRWVTRIRTGRPNPYGTEGVEDQ